MAKLSKAAYLAKFNNPATGLLKDNFSRDIIPERHRKQVEDTKDSCLFWDDDVIDEDDFASDSSTKVPTQQSVRNFVLANAGGVGGGGLGFSVQTSSVLNFTGLSQYVFAITSISSPRTISHTNDTQARRYEVSYHITNLAGTITFPSNYMISAIDARWNSSTKVWTPTQTGTYKGHAIWTGLNWLMDISRYPYDTAITPPSGGVFDNTFDNSFN